MQRAAAKQVIPMNHTHTYTWGNRAQVEKYRSYPLKGKKKKSVVTRQKKVTKQITV